MGPRKESLVAAAEAALGITFPPTYRRFVRELGAGAIAGEEFYGVVGGDFVNSAAPDVVWVTLNARVEYGLAHAHVYIYNLGDGTGAYLDTARIDISGECPVVAKHSVPRVDEPVEHMASDFGAFFYTTIKRALASWMDKEDADYESVQPIE